MPGYLNRFVELDLSEYGKGCFITIHNPKVVPQSMLEPKTRIQLVDGKPVDPEAATQGTREVIAGLVKEWRVYDASGLDDEQPELPLPATPESVAKLPFGVFAQLDKLIVAAIPDPS